MIDSIVCVQLCWSDVTEWSKYFTVCTRSKGTPNSLTSGTSAGHLEPALKTISSFFLTLYFRPCMYLSVRFVSQMLISSPSPPIDALSSTIIIINIADLCLFDADLRRYYTMELFSNRQQVCRNCCNHLDIYRLHNSITKHYLYGLKGYNIYICSESVCPPYDSIMSKLLAQYRYSYFYCRSLHVGTV